MMGIKKIKAELSGAYTLLSELPSDPRSVSIITAHGRTWLEHEVDSGFEPHPVPGSPDSLR